MDHFHDLQRALETLSTKGAFLTVADAEGRVNPMTISWGYVGFSWGKPYFVTLVRRSRYTHELLESAKSFTVSIPYRDDLAKALAVCGSTSGRDADKAAAAGIRFVPGKAVDSPLVEGCGMYYECKIGYVDTIHTGKLPPELQKNHYPTGDDHDLYYGEIVAAYNG